MDQDLMELTHFIISITPLPISKHLTNSLKYSTPYTPAPIHMNDLSGYKITFLRY